MEFEVYKLQKFYYRNNFKNHNIIDIRYNANGEIIEFVKISKYNFLKR